MTAESIVSRIQAFLNEPNAVLFAGAGVGLRVNLPSWPAFMEHLAATCLAYDDAASAALIRQKVADDDFTGAGTVYKACRRIPDGARFDAQAQPFRRHCSEDELDRLVPLAGLGFSAIVTTNYDSSLHSAFVKATGKYPRAVELDDGSLRGAALQKEHFLARIHGRADLPTTMRFSDSDYEDLRRNQTYLDFLLDLVKIKRCLFLGFSFRDPALTHVLRLLEESIGPNYPSLHTAILPVTDQRLRSELGRFNIATVLYNPDEGHRELWQGIRLAYDASRIVGGGTRAPSSAQAPALTSSTQRFMAFAYSQLQTRAASGPITGIVRDGIVLSTIHEGVSTLPQIEEVVRTCLALTQEEAHATTSASLSNLVSRGDLTLVGDTYTPKPASTTQLIEHLDQLADGLLRRMKVREGIAISQVDRQAAREIVERVLMVRAWDVAAHFAGAATGGWSSDLPGVIEQITNEQQKKITLSAPGAMARAALDLIRTPEDSEAKLLAELARAAFGLQIVLSTPRQALFQKYSLPQRIYLDANIVLPAITDGYPLRPVYWDLLQRLRTAASQAGVVLKIIAGSPFIEELLTHRQKAETLVRELKLEDPDSLARHIGYYTATNTNVFIGGYASFVGRAKNLISFKTYLASAAPYSNTLELQAFLKGFGIDAEVMDFREQDHPVFRAIYSKLLEGYEGDRPYYERQKETVLIVHEAQQLTRLRLDIEHGVRSIFVTADARLRRVMLNDTRLHDLLGSTITDLGLVALVDIMIGLQTDSRSLARLVWATQYNDAEKALMDYFIMLALREYDSGMAMAMQDIAGTLAVQAVADARTLHIDLLAHGADEMARTADFLDRYEDRFFRAAEKKLSKPGK